MKNHSEYRGILRAFGHAFLCMICFIGLFVAVTACIELNEGLDPDGTAATDDTDDTDDPDDDDPVSSLCGGTGTVSDDETSTIGYSVAMDDDDTPPIDYNDVTIKACQAKTAHKLYGPELIAALKAKDFDKAECLIGKDADINYQDETGNTPLRQAVFAQNLLPNPFKLFANPPVLIGDDYVKLFLGKEDLCVNVRDHNGKTALMHVADEKVLFLSIIFKSFYELEGLDPTIKDKNGNTALWLAARSRIGTRFNNVLGVEGTIRNQISHTNNKGQTLLHAAAISLNLSTFNKPDLEVMIQKIGKLEGDFNAEDNQGNTPYSLVDGYNSGLANQVIRDEIDTLIKARDNPDGNTASR